MAQGKSVQMVREVKNSKKPSKKMLQGRVDDLLRQILLTDGGLSSVMSLEVLLMISGLVGMAV